MAAGLRRGWAGGEVSVEPLPEGSRLRASGPGEFLDMVAAEVGREAGEQGGGEGDVRAAGPPGS